VRRVFVDTSGWYALVIPDSAGHAEVAQLMRLPDTTFFTSTFVLHELVALLISRRNRALATTAAVAIRSTPEVRLEHPDPAEEAKTWRLFLERPDKTYTLTDCLSFVMMRRLEITQAVAIDAHFLQEGFTVLV
jgi:predicted nucleic acid-binding protein